MNNWEQISSIVDRALDLEPDEQLAFVQDVCGDDDALKANVIHFLDSIEPSDGLWDKMVESGSVLVNEITSSDVDIDNTPLFSPLKQAGPYRVIELIARGGMGNVYLAERSDGQFDRTVAIKILRHELSSKSHVDRFSAERNILSGLEHPNIARLYDGGITDDNRPYLVMEYVDGVPITTYCKKNSCTLNEKLELFKQVCKAVEYAHRNLIVHRDLKPDNILVKQDGTVKILDFGIAKILDEELTPDKLVQTKENLHMLSIQYAAPEQVTLEKITTATDVYALGLLLYEMITGRPPFDLKGKNLKEAEQTIRFEIPEKPSARISDSGLSRKVKGDLDAIMLKALRKEPEYRHQTADQFLDDIDRFLTGRPVLAQKESMLYRTKKFILRRPVIPTSIIFMLFAIWGYIFTLQQHADQLEVERNIALSEALRAEQISDFLINMFQEADPFSSSKDITVREMLDRGTDQVLEDGLIEDPVVRAKFMETLGNVYRRLGALDKAEQLLMEAIQIRRSLYGSMHLEIASSLSRIGSLLTDQGNYVDAVETLREALTIQQELLGDDHHDTVDTMNNLANALQSSNRMNESELLYRKIISINRNHEDRQEYLATNLTSLGNLLSEQQNYTEAEELLHEALEIRQRILGREHPRTAVTLNNLAQMLRRSGSAESAEPLLRESIEIRKITLGDDHPSVAIGINNLALALRDMGRFDEAEPLFRESLERRINHFGEEHPATGIAYYNLAGLKNRIERYQEAEELSRKALQIWTVTFRPDHINLARVRDILAQSLIALNYFSEAEELLKEALVIYEDPQYDGQYESLIATVSHQLALTLRKQEKIDEAKMYFENAYRIRSQLLGSEHDDTLESLAQLQAIENSSSH